MNFIKMKKFLPILLLVSFLIINIISTTTKTTYIGKTEIINKKALSTDASLLASTQSIANYSDVEASIKEAINKELETKVDEKSEEALNEIALSAYPIGSIYISTSSTNPSQFIGGTWVAYGQGKTLIGAGTNSGSTYTAGSTGGEYLHKLTVDELPSHNHSITSKGSVSSIFTGAAVTVSTASTHAHTITATAASAGSHIHSINAMNVNVRIDNTYLYWIYGRGSDTRRWLWSL